MAIELFATNDATAALVATPNGEAPATFVHEIPSGSIVKYGTNGTFVFYNSQLILTLVNEGGSNLVNENSIAVPSAVSVPVSSCGNLNGNNYIGWIEDAETSASAPTSLTRFEATWKAPEQTPNTTESQAGPLAIFNGIQNASTGVTDGIMQPVSQLGLYSKGLSYHTPPILHRRCLGFSHTQFWRRFPPFHPDIGFPPEILFVELWSGVRTSKRGLFNLVT